MQLATQATLGDCLVNDLSPRRDKGWKQHLARSGTTVQNVTQITNINVKFAL